MPCSWIYFYTDYLLRSIRSITIKQLGKLFSMILPTYCLEFNRTPRYNSIKSVDCWVQPLWSWSGIERVNILVHTHTHLLQLLYYNRDILLARSRLHCIAGCIDFLAIFLQYFFNRSKKWIKRKKNVIVCLPGWYHLGKQSGNCNVLISCENHNT